MVLTLHLGAHKTASTHLQNSLRMVQGQLRAGGVFYADPAQLRGEGLPMTRQLRWRNPAAVAGIAACVSAARHVFPEMLLSDENILGGTHRSRLFGRQGMVYPGAGLRLRRLLDLAGGGPALLCLAVRDPAPFNVSAFALQLLLGNETGIEAYLQGRDPARLSWTGLVRRLAAVPGVAGVLVWRYEDYAALRPRLLARLLPPPLVALVPDPPRSNESLTQPGLDWFLSALARDAGADRRLLARAARERFPRAGGHAALRPLPEAAYRRSARHYAEDMARLADLPGVELLRP
ncbi:hypothetical protein [Paracoccus sp. (in: a-proteobacteria)]|uniref:hypothetical protein n=1 Tax=Paracoccus sp. TaxID=267 RepID=UPI00322001CE